MKVKAYLILIALFMVSMLTAATVFEQNFNVTAPPTGWSIKGYKSGGSHQGAGTLKTNSDLFKNNGGNNYLRLTEDLGYQRAWAYYTAAKFPIMGEWKITMEVRIGKTHNGSEITAGADGLCLVFAEAGTVESSGNFDLAKVEGGYGEFEGAPRGVILNTPSYLINSKGYQAGYKGFSFEFDHYDNANEKSREYNHWVDLATWTHSGLGPDMVGDTGFYYNDGWVRCQLDANNGVIIFRYNWNSNTSTYANSVTLNATDAPNGRDIYAYDAYLGICAATGGESAFHEVRYLKLEVEEDAPLPVELSSFSAIQSSVTNAEIKWTTQSETEMTGYYIYRGDSDNFSNALAISPLISANNTTTESHYTFTDSGLGEAGTYYYWLQAQGQDGISTQYGPITLSFQTGGGLDTPDIPLSTRIDAVYPNPFNPSTTISYIILKDAVVNISIFNDRGQLVRNINENHKIAGSYKTVWNGMDNYGNTCASGVYYLKMQAGNDVSIHKAVIMK